MVSSRNTLGLIRLVTATICIAMAPLASGNVWGELSRDEKKEVLVGIGNAINDLFNNGGWGHGNRNGNGNGQGNSHGNGNNSNGGGDGNNGHGNDAGGSDPSNPGNGGGNGNHNGGASNGNNSNGSTGGSAGSVSGVLGLETEPTSGSSTTTEPTGQDPEVTPPGTTTDDPFGDIVELTPDGEGDGDTPVSITSVPYGSVPTIRDDGESVDYLLDKLIADAQQAASDEGDTPQSAMALRKGYADYAKRLAKTLSRLTQAQQNIVFYGVE